MMDKYRAHIMPNSDDGPVLNPHYVLIAFPPGALILPLCKSYVVPMVDPYVSLD